MLTGALHREGGGDVLWGMGVVWDVMMVVVLHFPLPLPKSYTLSIVKYSLYNGIVQVRKLPVAGIHVLPYRCIQMGSVMSVYNDSA